MGEVTCPRCGARLAAGEAVWMGGVPGYQPALLWCHERPDGRGKCRVYSGPPRGGYEAAPGGGTMGATTLSAAQEAPERR